MAVMHDSNNSFVLLLTCANQQGLVVEVSRFLAEQGGFINSLEQSVDSGASTFFMRVIFCLDPEINDITNAKAEFTDLAEQYKMSWGIYAPKAATKSVFWPTVKVIESVGTGRCNRQILGD